MARRWTHLRATVFDSPTVCEIARKNIATSGFADRLDAIPGDCFADPFPKGADCLMFAHFFTIWGEKKDRELLKKCYDALPPGGKVIIFNMMQHDDETGPLSAAVGSLATWLFTTLRGRSERKRQEAMFDSAMRGAKKDR